MDNDNCAWKEWFEGLARGLSGVGVDKPPTTVLDSEPIGPPPMENRDAVGMPDYSVDMIFGDCDDAD